MYGRDELEWNELVDESYRVLEEDVRWGSGFTTYTELNRALAQRTGHAAFDFGSERDRAAIGHLLGELVERTFPKMNAMISSIVLYQGGSDAGQGFYRLATEMGLLKASPSPAEKDAFWSNQVQAVHNYFSDPVK